MTHPLVVKQYGAERTGTNALRLLLTAAFPGAEVLMHVLGDKHSPPTRTVRDPTLAAGVSPVALVTAATVESPARTTDLSDPAQRGEVTRVAPAAAAAIRSGELRVVVSVKDPYAWFVSASRLLGPEARPHDLCERFNRCYRAWFALVDELEERALVVRLEDLLEHRRATIDRLAACFGSECSADPGLPAEAVFPAHWDHRPSRPDTGLFDPAHYLEREYLTKLDPAATRVVTGAIDWALMARCGYEPVSPRPPAGRVRTRRERPRPCS